MKRLSLFFLLALVPLACARLPEIREVESGLIQHSADDCTTIFPRGGWQFVHAIQLFPPDGSVQTLVGVVRLFPEDKRLHCVMMTIEGLVLFEAQYDGTVTILRAIAPLDKPGVAEGMIEDIRLIFFKPEESGVQAGLTPEGARLCRYALPDGGNEDILLESDKAWEIRRYSPTHRLQRSIRPLAGEKRPPNGLAGKVELTTHGLAGYRLVMRLVEATPIEK